MLILFSSDNSIVRRSYKLMLEPNIVTSAIDLRCWARVFTHKYPQEYSIWIYMCINILYKEVFKLKSAL